MFETVLVFAGTVFGGMFVAVFNWLTNKPKAKLELNIAEVQGVDDLVKKIREEMQKTVKNEATIAGLELQVKIRESRLIEYESRQAEILRDHGAAEERERQGAQRIEELTDLVQHQAAQIAKNKSLTDQVAQQSALLEKLRREGIWKPEPTDPNMITHKRTRKDST